MKVGIITWHYLDNYGSVLQAYAMQKNFEKRGCSVEIINYRKNAKKGFINDFLRFFKYHFLAFNDLEKRKKKFYDFRKNFLNETKMYNNEQNLKNISDRYDAVVCGSDQIWSSKQFDSVYYLGFVGKNTKKYAYAPSAIQDDYTTNQKKIIKNNLNSFNMLSTREQKGVEILQKIIKKDICEVLDPTLLIEKNEWLSLVKKEKYHYENYVLCSFIGEDDKYRYIVEDIKEKYGCFQVININIKDIHNFGDLIIRDASPIDLLELISKAKVVVTDSYHICLFSITFEKEFYAIKRFEDNESDNQNERINNILSKLSLRDRYISYKGNINVKKIDYKKINKELLSLRKNSNIYIDNIIKGVRK